MSKGIVGRMAILWKQKELISQLEKLQADEMEYYAPLLGTAHFANLANIHLESTGEFWVPENKLVDKMLINRGKNRDDRLEVLKIKRLMTASIKDGFIEEKTNDQFVKEQPTYDDRKSSPRCLNLNAGRASELQNWWYFWFKYIPATFPDPAKIVVSVVVTIITAAVTASLITG